MPFPESPTVGITLYVAFSDWLLSHSNMSFSFLHEFSWLYSLFLLNTELYSIVGMYPRSFMH